MSTSREAIEAAAAPTLSERAAATPACPCNRTHRPGSKAAIAHAALYGPKLAPVAALPTVTGEDLVGALSLLDGRLVVSATAVRSCSPSRFGDTVPGEVADHDVILGLFAECGADMATLCRRMNQRVRAQLPLSTAIDDDLLEAAADLLNKQLAAEAAAYGLAA